MRDRMRIDLHIHSTASDGALAPLDVVAAARAGGLDLIALADHDTIAGVPTAMAAADQELRVIPAIEISATHDERDIHILGYGIDPAAPSIAGHAARARTAREHRLREMIDRLADLDVLIPFEAVEAEAGPGSSVLARPHLARVLWNHGHVQSVAEAFDRYIGDAGPAFVPVQLLDVGEAIQRIHDAGGLAVWAHPPVSMLCEPLDRFVAQGLDGLECHRPRVQPQDLARLLSRARRHDLLVTGGSDWHGEWNGPLGGFHIDRPAVDAFLDRLGI